ncbi:unnamed protein product [Rhodiola kirilowii]
MKYIQANGEGSWRSVPRNAGLQRCGKSCRLRWINYLRPDLKTAREEEIIIGMQASLGNRWSLLAGHLPGRTDRRQLDKELLELPLEQEVQSLHQQSGRK